MTTALSEVSDTSRKNLLRRAIVKFDGVLRRLKGSMWPTYRPEKHYMRGPGPACAKKDVY